MKFPNITLNINPALFERLVDAMEGINDKLGELLPISDTKKLESLSRPPYDADTYQRYNESDYLKERQEQRDNGTLPDSEDFE